MLKKSTQHKKDLCYLIRKSVIFREVKIVTYLYTRNERLKLFFFVQNHLFNLCFRVVNSKRLICSKDIVLNDCFKVFWFTKINGKSLITHTYVNPRN